MTAEEIGEMLTWVGNNFDKIPLEDQLVIAYSATVMAEQIKPVYLKHKLLDETTTNFIMKL